MTAWPLSVWVHEHPQIRHPIIVKSKNQYSPAVQHLEVMRWEPGSNFECLLSWVVAHTAYLEIGQHDLTKRIIQSKHLIYNTSKPPNRSCNLTIISRKYFINHWRSRDELLVIMCVSTHSNNKSVGYSIESIVDADPWKVFVSLS